MKDKIIEILNAYRRGSNFRKKFGIYIDNQPVYFGGKNIYASEGIAKRKILEHAFGERGWRGESSSAKAQRELRDSERMAMLDELILEGAVQIKEV